MLSRLRWWFDAYDLCISTGKQTEGQRKQRKETKATQRQGRGKGKYSFVKTNLNLTCNLITNYHALASTNVDYHASCYPGCAGCLMLMICVSQQANKLKDKGKKRKQPNDKDGEMASIFC